MRRHHRMPFGTEIGHDGAVCFRLWAPAAHDVDLFLDGEKLIPMQPDVDAHGWFEVVSHEAHAGSRYCYRIDGGLCVPDPASRYNPEDVHAPSQVVDPAAFAWNDTDWCGRPWEEAVIYELHVGTFSPEGTFAGVRNRLDYLAELGITAIEIMPVADFPGRRNWGYDGALLFAPDSVYGTPEDLKQLVQEAHQHQLMVLLDVVFNHFGPEGNYLHLYAPQFFTERHQTPWGAAINFDGEASRTVRDFYIHNACYWLEEFHFDGLRLDAVHAIFDDSLPDILDELATEVHKRTGNKRYVHLMLENDHNAAHYLARGEGGRTTRYAAQWNDDIHHALHTLLTGEHNGYYCDYADDPIRHLGRCLSEGFAYQGEPSVYRRGAHRGAYSAHLPPSAFITFLQNHDQIGNRSWGDRLTVLSSPEALRAVTVLLLLAPFPPLLFMGQEWGAREPFPFFCDFSADFAPQVTQGRRLEFAHEEIPDPCATQTFNAACLDWSALRRPPQRDWLRLHRELLDLRKHLITPRLRSVHSDGYHRLGLHALCATWRFGNDMWLKVYANLGKEIIKLGQAPVGTLLYCCPEAHALQLASASLPPFTVGWYLEEDHAHG